MKQNIQLKTSVINICKIALVAILPVSVSSCTLLTSSMPIEKLPEPIKSEMVRLKKDQEVMTKQYTAASIKMNEAYISIFKGCGMEKEAQQLQVNADALKQASSSSEHDKLTKRGRDLIAEGQSTMTKSKNTVLASKESFLAGFRQKDEAYMDLTKVSVEAGVQALAAAKTFKEVKNPMQKAACVAGLDPLIVVMKDIPVLMENERKFNAQASEIGKKYNCPIPSRTYKETPALKFEF